MRPLALLAAGAFLLAAGHSVAVEWHVNPAGTGDAPTIQAAYDLASPGDVIVLAPGTYRDAHTRNILDWNLEPTSGTAIAFASPGVDLVGAGADVTILDGEDAHHCLVGADLGVVEIRGITFLDGRTTGVGGLISKGGAGVLIFRSQATVENCAFRSCIAPELEVDGATGLYLVGGILGQVRYNLFVDNYGGDIGGAMGILEHSLGVVRHNTFVRNEAGDGGGAIEINASLVTLENNIFADNLATNVAGAVLCLNGTVVTGGCNLFWNNTAPVGPDVGGGCSFPLGDGDLVANPLFCDPVVDDFTLLASSPAAPGATACGQRGAFGVGCGPVSVESSTWGRIKASYR